MKRVGHLFDQIVDFHALREAARRASAGRRHKPAVASFLFHDERELLLAKILSERDRGAPSDHPFRLVS